MFRNRRRTVLVGLAGVVVALLAWWVVRELGGDRGDQDYQSLCQQILANGAPETWAGSDGVLRLDENAALRLVLALRLGDSLAPRGAENVDQCNQLAGLLERYANDPLMRLTENDRATVDWVDGWVERECR